MAIAKRARGCYFYAPLHFFGGRFMAIAKIKSENGSGLAIGLGANARREVAVCLGQLLADTYILQLKTQYYHWNVTGPHFAALHTLFGAQYDAIALAVDEVAERIRSVGHTTPGTFHEFASAASIREDKSLPKNWQEMVANLVEGNEVVARLTREWLPKIQKAGDEGTADLLIRRMQEHEKAAWMLRSHLQ
jgi:starvation-inducible DNA-binding protein